MGFNNDGIANTCEYKWNMQGTILGWGSRHM
jgi:hypothetical protein